MKILFFFLLTHSILADLNWRPSVPTVDLYSQIRCYGFNSQCYTKDSFELSLFQYFSGISRKDLLDHDDFYQFQFIDKKIKKSTWVKQTVILAFDQVYDEIGRAKKELSEYYIPNSFVAKAARMYDTILLGASIHPYRPNVGDALLEVITSNAKLVYLNPQKHKFDVTHSKFIALCQNLKEANLPLMIESNELEPLNIEPALKTGVTLILSGKWARGKPASFNKFNYYTDLVIKYPNLFATNNSFPYLGHRIDYNNLINFNTNWFDRILFGSNFPYNNTLLYSSWYHPRIWGNPLIMKLNDIKDNLWDHTVLFKFAIDAHRDTFSRHSNVIK